MKGVLEELRVKNVTLAKSINILVYLSKSCFLTGGYPFLPLEKQERKGTKSGDDENCQAERAKWAPRQAEVERTKMQVAAIVIREFPGVDSGCRIPFLAVKNVVKFCDKTPAPLPKGKSTETRADFWKGMRTATFQFSESSGSKNGADFFTELPFL